MVLHSSPMLHALSPLDGRYEREVEVLRGYFSEEALIRARVLIEVSYFVALGQESKVPELPPMNPKQIEALWKIVQEFDAEDAQAIKDIEKTTKHDVKAVEYFLKKKIEKINGLADHTEFIHFALTSEDVNNLAYGVLIADALRLVLIPSVQSLAKEFRTLAKSTAKVQMLSLTHGQPATPTTLGKEMEVFAARIDRQLKQFKHWTMQGKLGGAVGNFSAHRAAYPQVNWEAFRKKFVSSLGLDPLDVSTQINPHDDIAELSHLFIRINTILLDFSRDAWLYISRGVFGQKVVAGEVGSSTMPHKVNPIDFENAEGNLGLSNALFAHFAEKLPISRLQRDLSDSTVQRSIGTAFGYHLLAIRSLEKGLRKLSVNKKAIQQELDQHPEVYAEAIQTVLRKNGVKGAYEQLKELTRGEKVTKEGLREFIQSLALPLEDKQLLISLLDL